MATRGWWQIYEAAAFTTNIGASFSDVYDIARGVREDCPG